MTHSILIIEDDFDLNRLLAYNFEQAGYHVINALTAKEGFDAFELNNIDCVVLDLMLPDSPGEELCQKIRHHPIKSNIPVLILTAKSAEIDKIIGFESGADDYVTKPFSPKELMLRIQALIRRSSTVRTDELLNLGGISLNVAKHEVKINLELVNLTATEFHLLYYLMKHQGQVVNRERLLKNVWGYQHEVETRTVDVHVRRLRNKLGESGKFIDTVHGVGYRFSEEKS